jgi:phosphoglucosamine mutase
VGRVTHNPNAAGLYEHHLLATVPHHLDGLTIVVDCANGAASYLAQEVYTAAGATVIAIHATPDGLNINDGCGSTHMDDLIAAVIANGADAGIAHDGDADRCLAVDANGDLVDGDHILAILAGAMNASGALIDGTVVATVMANLGFKKAMEVADITVIETGVGDRYVLEAMRAGGFVLGGEQSGHVVMSSYATTGDGLLTGLHLLSEVARTGRSLADLAAAVTKLPQVLINVTGVDRSGIAGSAVLLAAVAQAEQELGDSGRVLLRPSGTEPVIRVMVEAVSEEEAAQVGAALADVVRAELAIG